MKKVITTSLFASLFSLSAFAGVLTCTGTKHVVVVNTKSKTIHVIPEMKSAVPVVIQNGPKDGLYIIYDKGETFLLYLDVKNGKTLGNLASRDDESLEEELVCTGSIK